MWALIISIDHFLQLVETSRDNVKRSEKKAALRALVLNTLLNHQLSAIFEESDLKN